MANQVAKTQQRVEREWNAFLDLRAVKAFFTEGEVLTADELKDKVEEMFVQAPIQQSPDFFETFDGRTAKERDQVLECCLEELLAYGVLEFGSDEGGGEIMYRLWTRR